MICISRQAGDFFTLIYDSFSGSWTSSGNCGKGLKIVDIPWSTSEAASDH